MSLKIIRTWKRDGGTNEFPTAIDGINRTDGIDHAVANLMSHWLGLPACRASLRKKYKDNHRQFPDEDWLAAAVRAEVRDRLEHGEVLETPLAVMHAAWVSPMLGGRLVGEGWQEEERTVV